MSDPIRVVSAAEERLLRDVTLHGSDGYPIRRYRSGGWSWGTDDVPGPPTVFRTKRAAVESFERFLDVLIEAKGEAARVRALSRMRDIDDAEAQR